ncbi:MAG: hypothetical protein ACFFKA_10080 [Candidatus Thorarchaeota archaeon]
MDSTVIWLLILLGSYFIILFFYLHFSYKPDIINNIFGFGALIFTFFNIILVMFLMNQDSTLYLEIIPMFSYTLGLPLILISLIIVFSTIILFFIRKFVKTRDFNKFWMKVEENSKKRSKLLRDTLRKIPHVLIFLGLLVVWYIGTVFVIDFSGSTSGMIPEVQDMARLYFGLIENPNNIRGVLFSLGWFYYLLFFFFYTLNLIMIANEFTRKTHSCAFPFNFICRIFFCEEEKLNYGAYLYFTVGQMFAAFITPPMVFFAILGISSISDLLTSQIGIRYGKSKIKWNQEKSWQGTFAGILSCFIISLLFIGIVWAIIFTLGFLVFDIITNKPLKLSDNLLLPIGFGLIYTIIQFFFRFEIVTIFLIWIS